MAGYLGATTQVHILVQLMLRIHLFVYVVSNDWDDQTFILTYWQKWICLSCPVNIKTILDSETIRLNGLTLVDLS